MRSKEVDHRQSFTERARREQIVRCAMEVINELGYPQTSIRKIADRVGVAMSVVLYHFSNKDALVGAIMADAISSVVAAVAPAMEAEPTATGKLHAYLRSSAAFIQLHPMQFGVIVDIGMNYRSATGQRVDQLALDPALLVEFAKLDLQSTLRLGQDTGEFRSLDTKNTALAISSALNGAVLEISRDPGFDVVGYGELLVSVFDSAVLDVAPTRGH
jgi:AcrR family transcriptional regulator